MTFSSCKLTLCQILLVVCRIVSASAGQVSACDQISALEDFTQSNVTPDGAVCSTYLTQTAGMGVSCYWEFPFRDGAARVFADAAWSEMKNCRGGREAGPDALVNHPDSYDLRALETGNATYSVAVKDKGGLQKTLVFLKYEHHQE